jgi:hypothetical protein
VSPRTIKENLLPPHDVAYRYMARYMAEE